MDAGPGLTGVAASMPKPVELWWIESWTRPISALGRVRYGRVGGPAKRGKEGRGGG
jgi:hypothetical protein